MLERRISTAGTLGRLLLAGVVITGTSWEPVSSSTMGTNKLPTPIIQQSPSPWVSAEIQIAINTSVLSPLPTETSSPTALPTPIATPEATPAPESTVKPTPEPKVLSEINTGYGSEPDIAVNPTNPDIMAVTYQQVGPERCHKTGIRVSQDSGLTWEDVESMPGDNQMCFDVHSRIAWGSDNTLWWTNGLIVSGGAALGIAYTKDFGESWNTYQVEGVNPWVGRYPDITVDNNPDSPNFGIVAGAYNFDNGNNGSGIGVVVSGDNGNSWQKINIPVVGENGYPKNWLINSQIKSLPNGDLVLTFSEFDMNAYDSSDPLDLNDGSWGSIGGARYTMVIIHYDRVLKRLTTEQPSVVIDTSATDGSQWDSGLAVDNTGGIYVAVSKSGTIDLVHDGEYENQLEDGGSIRLSNPSWVFELNMNGQTCFKPSLAVKDNMVFVGFHTLDEGGVKTYYIISYDKGETFSSPHLVTSYAWSQWSVAVLNGVGLRENVTFGVDAQGNPLVYYAYGVGRDGQPNVDVAVINPQ